MKNILSSLKSSGENMLCQQIEFRTVFVRRGVSSSRIDEVRIIFRVVPNVQANRPIAEGWYLG